MSKRKSTHHQKNHTEASGGMTDLWYLERQKQEKHIELSPIHQ